MSNKMIKCDSFIGVSTGVNRTGLPGDGQAMLARAGCLAGPIQVLKRGRERLARRHRRRPQALFGLANEALLFQCSPMQSHELLREVFQKCSPKQVAAELGLSLSMIYKWAEPGDPIAGSGSTNPLDRIDALIRCSKDPHLVQWICQRAGGFFIQNPKTTNPHPAYLIPATNEIVQEFADLLAVVAAAAADNQITQRESKQIRARWEELKSVTETFVACCEEGNFGPLKEKQMGSPKPEARSPTTENGNGRGVLNGSANSGKAGEVKR